MAFMDFNKQIKNLEQSNDADLALDAWVSTVVRLQARIPALGSVATINRYLVQQNGIPYRRLGRRLLFNVQEVYAWMSSQGD